MRNFQFGIRICQKIHNKVTRTISSYFHFCHLCQFPEIHENLSSNILSLSLYRIIVLAPSVLHFKDLGMRNLQYEIKKFQKNHNKVTMTMSSYFNFLPILSMSRNPFKAMFQHFYEYLWIELLYRHLLYLILKVLT